MKRITISLAAVALMFVAADTASAQSIRIVGGGYYPSYGYRPYVAPVYVAPVYVAPPVYVQPGFSAFYSTPINNSGRLTVGYSSGWGSFANYSYGTPYRYATPYRYGAYATPHARPVYYGGYRR